MMPTETDLEPVLEPLAVSIVPPGPVRPTGGLGFWGGFGLCLIWAYVATMAALFLDRLFLARMQPAAMMATAHLLATTATIWLGLRWTGLSLREALPLRRFPARIIPALLLAIPGLVVLCLWLAARLPMAESLARAMMALFEQSGWIMAFLLVVVAAPVFEESLFRGLILGALRRRYGTATAICVSTVLFALIHGNPPQMVAATVLGLGASWLVVRTGSLLPGMLLHATWNLSPFLLPLLVPALAYNPRHGIVPALPAALLLTAALITLLALALLGWQLHGPGAAAAPALELHPRSAAGPLTAVLGLPLLAVLVTSGMKDRLQHRPDPKAVAGCYQLFSSVASTPIALFGDSAAATIRVRLAAARTSFGGDSARYLAYPFSAAGGAPADTAFWFPVRGDSLRLVRLRPDLSGTVVRLFLGQPGPLRGSMTRYAAKGSLIGTATVLTVRRLPCPPPARE